VSQVSQLSLQIALLRQLNGTESKRAAAASAELLKARSLIELANKKLDELKLASCNHLSTVP